MQHDGLWDPYNNHHMGLCAEKCSAGELPKTMAAVDYLIF
jgi:hypothetical protein